MALGAQSPGDSDKGDQVSGDRASSEQLVTVQATPSQKVASDLEGADAQGNLEEPLIDELHVEIVVTDLAEPTGGVVRGFVVVAEHALVDAGSGPPPRPAAVTVSCAGATARGIVAGEVPPSVAYMQGTLRMTGATGTVLDLLACTAIPGFARLMRSLEEITDD